MQHEPTEEAGGIGRLCDVDVSERNFATRNIVIFFFSHHIYIT